MIVLNVLAASLLVGAVLTLIFMPTQSRRRHQPNPVVMFAVFSVVALVVILVRML